ncbi:hypothetical protein C7S18_18470 [Ahniella affigens]|uniref:HIT domain-containing protein n=1 Tax=Ahniella affigens TaxID=2021234 RepID=A0A2P1PW07_9GAMM|nr:dienelactone hydrolase family protein [Ahniella affigens]AVP99038.1 hypothetical protein C7S18_18470 [Ahniella affigens]
MSEWITLTADDGHTFSAFLARPAGTPLGAVIVLQEVFGVNHHIRWVAEQFADHGFVALAPALFDRVGGNLDLDYTDTGIAVGREKVAALGFDAALRDVAAAAAYLGGCDRVGVVGYCWGGTLCFLANTRLGLTAVSYYGARSRPFLHEPTKAPLLMHFGRKDPLIPQDFYAELAEKQPTVPVHFYDAGHGFNCNERADFHAESAALAWRRTFRFFKEHLPEPLMQAGPAPEPDLFELDPRLAADAMVLLDWPLCRVLLMNDARFPWLILVPRVQGLREVLELTESESGQLMREIRAAQAVLTALYEPDKLNVAALGNVVPQLHVHVLARFEQDAAWPKPVFGIGTAQPYAPGALHVAEKTLREALTAARPE